MNEPGGNNISSIIGRCPYCGGARETLGVRHVLDCPALSSMQVPDPIDPIQPDDDYIVRSIPDEEQIDPETGDYVARIALRTIPSGDSGANKYATPLPEHRDHSEVHLMDVREVQATIGLKYKSTLHWIRKHIDPLGGSIQMGNKKLVHRWALNEALRKQEWVPQQRRKKGLSPRSKYVGRTGAYQKSLKRF